MIYYVGMIPCSPFGLQHWGIKGQKWGQRRFRNPDGTLTDAGKARYKNPKDMTDKELRDAVQRLQNEKQYKQLIKELDEKPVSKGAKFVSKTFSFIGNKVVGPLLESGAKALGKAFVDAMADDYKEKNDKKQDKQEPKKESSKKTNNTTYTTRDFGEHSYDYSAPGLPSGKKRKNK